MSSEHEWDQFIAWAKRFYDWPDFDTEERAYKLALGARLHAVRDALAAGDSGWVGMLRQVLRDRSNNLTFWMVNNDFLRYCEQQPEQAGRALVHLWDGPESDEVRVHRFMEEVPNEAVRSQHGMFASFLLLALGAETHPMYRDQAYRMAYRMTGYPNGPAHDSGAIYAHAVGFLDTLLSEAQARGLNLRDRLDAQSLLWCVTWYKVTDAPVSVWSEQDREALLAYRQTAGGSRSTEAAEESEGEAASDATVWMFQYNPNDYSLEDHIRTKGTVDWWAAAQHRRSMRIGQRVYIRRSGGSERAALVAVGRLVSSVRTSTAGHDPYVVDVLFEGWIDPPLTVHEMREDEVLKDYHPFSQGVFQTNFIVPREVAERAEHLVQDRIRPITSDDDIGTFQPDPELDTRTRVVASIVRRQGQPEFRQQLIEAYGGRCAITGCDAVDALEAAHIVPYRGQESNHPANGLLLRADLHTLFDLGLLVIDSATMTVVLSPSLRSTTYADLEGAPMQLPTASQWQPSRAALDQHRSQVG